jgi:predicted Na+-dependent transporter
MAVIDGLMLAAIGLGLVLAPSRAFALCWVSAVIGVWLIISPWVSAVGHSATSSIIWNNVATGAVAFVLGSVAVGRLVGVVPPLVRSGVDHQDGDAGDPVGGQVRQRGIGAAERVAVDLDP